MNSESRMVDPRTDLANKESYQANSWFAIGHFVEEDGNTLNWLYHIIVTKMGPLHVVDSNFSMYNETTGEYHYEDKIFRPFQCEIRDTDTTAGKGFAVTCPMGSISGDPDHIHVQAKMSHGSVTCDMTRTRDYIYNAGTGSFMTFLGGRVQQFSMAHMDSSGTLVMGERSYPIHGDSWFDRQWQFSKDEQKTMKMHSDWKWTWMDLNLDNGETISLWDMNDLKDNSVKTWGTILHADNTQEVVEINPISEGEGDYWKSSASKNTYPTSFTVTIPSKKAKLNITTGIKNQEIVCKMPLFTKYEAGSEIHGTYEGKPVSGYCYVELLGKWE